MRLTLVLTVIVSLASVASADLLIREYSQNPARYDRFANSSSFIGAGLDLSGVGQDATAAVHWATMISPHFFVSAGHYQPSGTVTFYDTNSTSGGSQSYTVFGGMQINVEGQSLPTDLYVGILDNSVSASGIAYYPVLDLNLLSVGRSLLVYGKPNRVGTNTIAQTGTFGLTNGGGTLIATTKGYEFTYGQTGSPDDAQLLGGDSGGPSFTIVGGQLALVGTHSGASTQSYPYLSLDTSPSFYINQVNAAMASLAQSYGIGTGEHLTVIPEPAAFALLASGLLACVVGWFRGRMLSRRQRRATA